MFIVATDGVCVRVCACEMAKHCAGAINIWCKSFLFLEFSILRSSQCAVGTNGCEYFAFDDVKCYYTWARRQGIRITQPTFHHENAKFNFSTFQMKRKFRYNGSSFLTIDNGMYHTKKCTEILNTGTVMWMGCSAVRRFTWMKSIRKGCDVHAFSRVRALTMNSTESSLWFGKK